MEFPFLKVDMLDLFRDCRDFPKDVHVLIRRHETKGGKVGGHWARSYCLAQFCAFVLFGLIVSKTKHNV